jgi:hypothetical protein
MFNSFSLSVVSAQILKLVTILFAATAVMAGYPCAASAQSEPRDPCIWGGE